MVSDSQVLLGKLQLCLKLAGFTCYLPYFLPMKVFYWKIKFKLALGRTN